MKNFKKVFLCALCAVTVVLFAGCSGVGSGANAADLSGMIAREYNKVVSIVVNLTGNRRVSGSGIIIYHETDFCLIATNAHVVGYMDGSNNYIKYGGIGSPIQIQHWSDELREGEIDYTYSPLYGYAYPDMFNYTSPALSSSDIIYADPHEDLAIIKYGKSKYATNFSGDIAATLRIEPLRVGEPVAALGFSLGVYYRASVGVVSQIFNPFSYDDDGIKKTFEHGFLHDATAISGNSGGPVFDANGKVIGLTTMVGIVKTLDGSHDLLAMGFSIAISSRHIWDVVNTHKNDPSWQLSAWA